MTEMRENYTGEKSASAPPPPPPYYPANQAPYAVYGNDPNYPANQPPYATYGGNPNYPPYQQAVVYPQPMYPNIQRIHEYLPWSLINLCFGGLILGAIAIGLSLITRSYKKRNDAVAARRWSIVTLIFNIFVTLLGIAIIIFVIVRFAVVVKNIQSNY